jgi:hypothetical protein
MEHAFITTDGTYWQTISEPSEELIATYPKGTVEVPLRPNHLHTWDGKKWNPPSKEVWDAFVSEQVRFQRQSKLVNEVDPIVTNPLRWGDLTESQQQAWKDYRRALLDITKQEGFPHDITWPTSPTKE